jgi:kynurenine formamidase
MYMIVDLTHTIEPEMPVYPGTPSPSMEAACTVERDGYRETMLHMVSHTGTHMDAPCHLLPGGETLDAMAPDRFCGNAAVVDVSHLGERGIITEELLRTRQEELQQAEFVLFYTGWEQKWGKPDYFSAFPVMDEEAARFLVSCGMKGVGTDAISVDPVEMAHLPVHRVLLGAGMVIVENLRLQKLAGGRRGRFYALPLKYRNADGAPVRAVAEIPDGSGK